MGTQVLTHLKLLLMMVCAYNNDGRLTLSFRVHESLWIIFQLEGMPKIIFLIQKFGLGSDLRNLYKLTMINCVRCSWNTLVLS